MKLFFEIALLMIVVCIQTMAQNTNNLLKENYSNYLDDNNERKIIKYLVSLPEKEWRIFNILIRNDFSQNYKKLNHVKNTKKISLQSQRFIKFLLSFPEKEASKIYSSVKRARHLRNNNKNNDNDIIDLFKDDLPEKPRKFSTVCQLLKKAVSAKETVMLLRELERDHIHEPQLISIVKPYLHSKLAESVDVCINFTMMSRFYVVSSTARAIIVQINTKEANQLLLNYIHTPNKTRREKFNKFLTAIWLRNNGYSEATFFIDKFVEQKDKGYEIYTFVVGPQKHPDDLRYYFYNECKNNKNTTGLYGPQITQKLTKQLRSVPYEKKAIKLWFKKNGYLLVYDDLLGKWDILDKR